MPVTRYGVVSKADLHVHSKYSGRPSDWFLRRIGAPESFVEPTLVYETAKTRGMDFVTISDHNCINGALEIAHLPDTFISAEVTTYFPDDGCKVHCLVCGIDEAQFAMIQELRESIFELQRYLLECGARSRAVADEPGSTTQEKRCGPIAIPGGSRPLP